MWHWVCEVFQMSLFKIWILLIIGNRRPTTSRPSHLPTLWPGLHNTSWRIWQLTKQPARPSHCWTEESTHLTGKHNHWTWQYHYYPFKAKQHPQEWTVSFLLLFFFFILIYSCNFLTKSQMFMQQVVVCHMQRTGWINLLWAKAQVDRF